MAGRGYLPSYNLSDYVLTHGTSSKFLPEIRRKGLSPRGARKSTYAGDIESNPDLVYLGLATKNQKEAGPNHVFQGWWDPYFVSISASEMASEKSGGQPVMLWFRLKDGDAEHLTLDEDAAMEVCPHTYRKMKERTTPKIEDLTPEQQAKVAWSGMSAIKNELPPTYLDRSENKACEVEAAREDLNSYALLRCESTIGEQTHANVERQADLQQGKDKEARDWCNLAPSYLKSLAVWGSVASVSAIPPSRIKRVDVRVGRDWKTIECKDKKLCPGWKKGER